MTHANISVQNRHHFRITNNSTFFTINYVAATKKRKFLGLQFVNLFFLTPEVSQ